MATNPRRSIIRLLRKFLIPVVLVAALSLSACTPQWVQDWHGAHGHFTHSQAQYESEADLFTRYWAAVAQQHQQQSDLVYRWQGVANCESGGNWSINTGNGYFGGLQFLLGTWRSVGGSGYPHQNSAEEQAYRAEILKNRAGLGQWPSCGRFYR